MLEPLSQESLKRITGLQRPTAIRRFLDKQRIPYMMGADGWPRVLEAVIAERMGGQVMPTAPEPKLRLRNG